MELVKVSMEDAEMVSKINVCAFEDERKKFGPWKNNEGPEWYQGKWYTDLNLVKQLIKEHYYYKILVDQEIIGCFWLHDIDEKTIELEDFCILPEYQGKGYGYQALRDMEKLFPSRQKCVLGTPAYSIRNHHLYEKAGYRKVGMTAEDMVFLYEKNIDHSQH